MCLGRSINIKLNKTKSNLNLRQRCNSGAWTTWSIPLLHLPGNENGSCWMEFCVRGQNRDVPYLNWLQIQAFVRWPEVDPKQAYCLYRYGHSCAVFE